MADYIKAFKQGLGAAEAADRARKEIDAVFVDLNKQLQEATKNKISIDRREYEERKTLPEALSIPFLGAPRKTYWAIVASNPSINRSPVKQLSRWSMDRAGYPCKIAWKGEDHLCLDKSALEDSLAELLQDPLVGEKFHALMQLEEPPPEEKPAQQEDASDKE